MDISSLSKLDHNLATHTPSKQTTPPEAQVNKKEPDVYVSISPDAKKQYEAELNKTDETSTEKKDFGKALRADDSILNTSKNEKKELSPEEKLDKRIEDIKEKIKDLQKEIQTLRSNNSEKNEDKIKVLDQQLQALLGELNTLMEQKLESMKK